jgi:hypothetical protein
LKIFCILYSVFCILREKVELVGPAGAPGAREAAAGAAAQHQAMLVEGDDEVRADDQDEYERPGDYNAGWRGKALWEQVARAKKEQRLLAMPTRELGP